MARSKCLMICCSLLVLFNVCLAQGRQQEFKASECQIDRLTALEPTRRIEAEAGLTEIWDSNDQQFQCAGVTVFRRTIQPKGLLLPSFTSAPEIVYIEQGRGLLGLMIPGCPETFESVSQQPWQGEERDERSSERGMRGSFQDQHQKIRRFRQGDVVALPAGIAHWIYNDGNEPMVDIVLVDTANNLNQLDQDVPRRFYLAGKHEQEYEHFEQKGRREGRRGERSNGNIFSGFDTRILAESFGVSEETARRLQSEEDDRGNIVNVHEGLQVIKPPRRFDERDEEREERKTRRGRGDYSSRDNGVEETFCSARFIENLDDPDRADIYTPRAGRISTLNTFNLPILQLLRLSAEKGVLYRDAVMAPLYNLNAHEVVYCVQGRARVQIVNDQGNQIFNDELSKGQLVVVPQNFAVVKQAVSEQGFEWISFKTSENAMFQTLAGRTSAIRALPLDVISNIYQIPRDQAEQLKFSRPETTLFRSRNPGYQGRAIEA